MNALHAVIAAEALEALPDAVVADKEMSGLSWRAYGASVGIPWQTVYGIAHHKREATTGNACALLYHLAEPPSVDRSAS